MCIEFSDAFENGKKQRLIGESQTVKPCDQEVALVDEGSAWGVCKQAPAVQGRQSALGVGAAIDRRASEATFERYDDENIQAMLCFVARESAWPPASRTCRSSVAAANGC